MKIVVALATVAACSLIAGNAEAQTPKPCTVYIEIDNKVISNVSQRKTKCEFTGRVKFLINNNSNDDYRIKLSNFRPRTNGDCTKPPGSPGRVPITKNRNEVLFVVFGGDEVKARYKIKDMGGASTECYKFDITLYDEDWNYITQLDPDLEIGQPSGPPPPPPGGGGGQH
jgi:hypothetical protein